jgi:peroxiredoxin Q/BCP
VLKVGELAPDFVLSDHTGRDVRLRELEGKRTVLWFFPKVNTPGCRGAAEEFVASYPEFVSRDVALLGVSPDSVADSATFARECQVPFPLLCDLDLEVAVEYGAVDSQDDAFAKRITYVIDAEGNILHVFRSVQPHGHAAEVLRFLDEGDGAV